MVVNVHQAKTQLSRLLARVEAGEEIVIARRGTRWHVWCPANPRPSGNQTSSRGKSVSPGASSTHYPRKCWQPGKVVRRL